MKIGVLDIQGSVEEHFSMLQKLNCQSVLVKTKNDLENLSGLIIPGGESTTIGQLLHKYELDKEIIKKVKNGMAVWGTCAGAILLAKLKLIDVELVRNAYGRQVDSFETQIKFNYKNIPAIFIRAPKIVKVGKGVEVLAKFEKEIVAVQQKKILLTTFHPELTDNLTVPEYFVELCRKS